MVCLGQKWLNSGVVFSAPQGLHFGSCPLTAEEGGILSSSLTTFSDLGVDRLVVEELATLGITKPFPIQKQAIPIAMNGTDLIGQARTGTGKTLAFGLPMLSRIQSRAPSGAPQGLVVCPTRELALQVAGDLSTASRRLNTIILSVYGGVSYDPQLDKLAHGVDIVVGTPGRLIDLLNRGNLNLESISVLVLDEADEMLDLGFLPDVVKLIEATPAQRQTMLFSATMPAAIISLARTYLKQPINIRAEAHEAAATVPETTQFVYQTHHLDKPAIIAKLLQARDATKVMIFCSTKREVEHLSEELMGRGFKTVSIHGNLSQMVRERSLRRFRTGKAQTIICTDVAARGIDVDNVTHVINYNCPDDDKTYLHRIGRTGRAGRSGTAITFVDWADIPRWKVIDKALELNLPPPMEAYSTTETLLIQLGIPLDATDRITPPAEPESPLTNSRQPQDVSQRKPGRRQRTSNGVIVAAKTETQTQSNKPSRETTKKNPRRRRRPKTANS